MLVSTNNRSLSSSWKLVFSVLICEITGIVSGLLAGVGSNVWFESLTKPSWNPPDSVFGPVWTLLYLMMGISLWIIWKHPTHALEKRNAIRLFAIQLFLNFCWSIIFFRFHSIGLALVDIVLLLVAITLTIVSFSRISKQAAWLLVPYISWVSFATILNYSLWVLNPS